VGLVRATLKEDFMHPVFRSSLVISTLVLIAACGSAPEQTAPQDVPEYTIEQFLGNTNVFGSSFSPDKSKVLVTTDQSGIYNVWAIPIAGGEPVQLTHSESERVFSGGYFPTDERFFYSSDQGGNEQDHVYVQELDGTTTDLTPGELKANLLGWAWDDETFFISTNERDRRFFDVYEYSPDDYSRELIYQDETGYFFSGISPNRRYLAFVKTSTTFDSDIYLYDRDKEQMAHLTPHEGDINYRAVTFTPDSSALLMLSDESQEFSYLLRHDLESGDREVIEQTSWDVNGAYYSRGGTYMVVLINNDARTEVKVYETATMEPVELPKLPEAEISSVGFARDESLMAFYASNSRSPRDLFILDLATGEQTQLTSTLNPEIDPAHLVDGQVVRFTSFDGVVIPGILYKPHQASATAKAPALVSVHGGPGGQSRIGYRGMTQYLVNHGYVVYAINNRGSSGYGKTFYKMDDRAHGDTDLGDCVASKQMLIDTGYVDAEQIGIIGGSYGGYMVLAALTFTPEEFAVGIDMFGISNWLRTLESIPPHWEAFRKALYVEIGDPNEDREYLKEISPLFHADKIVRPLMVLQGANDIRVLQAESDEIVEAARANGVPVEYVLFEDEGHGFLKKENQLEGYKKVLAFLEQHLRGVEPEPETETEGA
jgi:dipeptidyl aminopeptidase/acylaminoacyl peptidase